MSCNSQFCSLLLAFQLLNLRPLIPMTRALTLSYTPEDLETDGNNRPNPRAFVNRNSESALKVSANGEQSFKILCATCSGAACLYSLERSGTENLRRSAGFSPLRMRST